MPQAAPIPLLCIVQVGNFGFSVQTKKKQWKPGGLYTEPTTSNITLLLHLLAILSCRRPRQGLVNWGLLRRPTRRQQYQTCGTSIGMCSSTATTQVTTHSATVSGNSRKLSGNGTENPELEPRTARRELSQPPATRLNTRSPPRSCFAVTPPLLSPLATSSPFAFFQPPPPFLSTFFLLRDKHGSAART